MRSSASLNQRASTKAKLQRYDTMLEQINIRKVQLSQRVLKLKSQESEQGDHLTDKKARYGEICGDIETLLSESRGYEEKSGTASANTD